MDFEGAVVGATDTSLRFYLTGEDGAYVDVDFADIVATELVSADGGDGRWRVLLRDGAEVRHGRIDLDAFDALFVAEDLRADPLVDMRTRPGTTRSCACDTSTRMGLCDTPCGP